MLTQLCMTFYTDENNSVAFQTTYEYVVCIVVTSSKKIWTKTKKLITETPLFRQIKSFYSTEAYKPFKMTFKKWIVSYD